MFTPGKITVMTAESKPKTLEVVGLIYIRDGKLLVTKSQKYDKYYLPGGKIELGESPEQALIREVSEEIGANIHIDSLKLYQIVSSDAYGQGSGVKLKMYCYQAEISEEPSPCNEIEKIAWFTYKDLDKCPPAGKVVMDLLLSDSLITF